MDCLTLLLSLAITYFICTMLGGNISSGVVVLFVFSFILIIIYCIFHIAISPMWNKIIAKNKNEIILSEKLLFSIYQFELLPDYHKYLEFEEANGKVEGWKKITAKLLGGVGHVFGGKAMGAGVEILAEKIFSSPFEIYRRILYKEIRSKEKSGQIGEK